MSVCKENVCHLAFPILNAVRSELGRTRYWHLECVVHRIAVMFRQVLPSEKESSHGMFPICDALRHELDWNLILPNRDELRTELAHEQRLLAGGQEAARARRGMGKQ